MIDDNDDVIIKRLTTTVNYNKQNMDDLTVSISVKDCVTYFVEEKDWELSDTIQHLGLNQSAVKLTEDDTCIVDISLLSKSAKERVIWQKKEIKRIRRGG